MRCWWERDVEIGLLCDSDPNNVQFALLKQPRPHARQSKHESQLELVGVALPLVARSRSHSHLQILIRIIVIHIVSTIWGVVDTSTGHDHAACRYEGEGHGFSGGLLRGGEGEVEREEGGRVCC